MEPPIDLHLPHNPVPDRVSVTQPLPANERRALVRIYLDGEPAPRVEAPVGDFFGVMHGLVFCPVDSHSLSVKAWNGYSCYFPLPFARSARMEVEAGPEGNRLFLQVDWRCYPG